MIHRYHTNFASDSPSSVPRLKQPRSAQRKPKQPTRRQDYSPYPLTGQHEQTLLERDHEIQSLQHKLSLAETELEKSEDKLKQLKAASDEGETHRATGENLQRKVQLLEEELDKAEKDLKEVTEK